MVETEEIEERQSLVRGLVGIDVLLVKAGWQNNAGFLWANRSQI